MLVAVGLIISMRSLGGTIGISIYSVLFTRGMRYMVANIAQAILPAGFASTVIILRLFTMALISQIQGVITQVPCFDPEILSWATHALLDTYACAFRNLWISVSRFIDVAAVGEYIPSFEIRTSRGAY